MTTATVQLTNGEVLRDLPLADAGDLVSAGAGIIIGHTTTSPVAVIDVPMQTVTGSPKVTKTGGKKR